MHSNDLDRSLSSLLRELVHGTRDGSGFVLNPGDPGLLDSLDKLSAMEASRSSGGGATIAGHVDHLRYGISLLNRWAAGENPFGDADWTAAWATTTVSEARWAALRDELASELAGWAEALASPREISGIELDGVLGSVIHLGYHLGAIRQISAESRGPEATATQ